MKTKIKACAKINLGLNIVAKRPDGYHDLETVFYPIPLYDDLEITQVYDKGKREPLCQLHTLGMDIPGNNNDNLVTKAYQLLAKHHDLPAINVELNKQIPLQAGMGGGSSDAANMIKLANQYFDLGLSVSQMQAYAAQLGADCAFFITAQPAYATGIGEQLTPFDETVFTLKDYYLVLVKPRIAVSTKEAFSGIQPKVPQYSCQEVVCNTPVDGWKDLLVNDFEPNIFALYPALAQIKAQLYSKGADYAAMSGSGSSVFGLFKMPLLQAETLFPDCFVRVLRLA